MGSGMNLYVMEIRKGFYGNKWWPKAIFNSVDSAMIGFSDYENIPYTDKEYNALYTVLENLGFREHCYSRYMMRMKFPNYEPILRIRRITRREYELLSCKKNIKKPA